MRKILTSILIIFIISGCQLNNSKIPNDPAVTIGKLENGLTYYIQNNKKPENRIEMLLVLNAGSVLETDKQQGLAHFIEHMGFNGTKSFPKQELVEYLESIGMNFGPDLNAYTSFDETVYMLQVPTNDEEKLEKGFQILAEWAHYMSFDDEEIDKERGVVVEEWRLRGGAWKRMADKQLPVIFKGSKYAQRLPIGKKAVIDTFHYDTAKDFYNKWYRPELMAVITVGDVEKSKMETLIKKYFNKIPKSNPTIERPVISVPDHDETLFTIASDPEASYSNVELIHKFEPEKDKMSINSFRNSMIFNLYNNMINNRLDELTKEADPPFLFVRSRKGSYIQSKEMYTLSAYVKTNGIPRGMEALLVETSRVQKHGFTQTELDREKTKYLRNIEKKYNEKDKTESESYKWKYKNNFLEGSAIPSIDYVYEMTNKLISNITINEVNKLSKELINTKNRVIAASSPENKGVIIPTENDLKQVFDKVLTMDIKPYVDEVSNEPLVSSLNPAGKVINETKIDEIELTEWTLSNGIKVVLKPTTFKNDEILFYAQSPGGTSLVEDKDFIAAETATDIISESGLGNFNKIELDKLLSDKIVKVSPWMDALNEGFKGSTSPKDLETMFQLIYQYFNSPRSDKNSYLAFKSRMEGWIENQNANPENVFRDSVSVTKYQNHFRSRPWTLKVLDEMNMDNSYKIFKDRFSDAGDFTFYFVGSFKIDNIKPLVEKYLGSLTATERNEKWKDVELNIPDGIVKNSAIKGIDPKSMVRLIFHGDFKWNRKNHHILKSLEGVMEIKLREILREDMGGTYGVWIWSQPKHYPKEKYELNIMFGCSPDNVEILTNALFTQIESLKKEGIGADYVSKVQEKQRQARDVDIQENRFWLNAISKYYYHNENPLNILEYDKLVDALSVDIIKQASRKYLNTKNYVQVVLYPEQPK